MYIRHLPTPNSSTHKYMNSAVHPPPNLKVNSEPHCIQVHRVQVVSADISRRLRYANVGGTTAKRQAFSGACY